MVLLMLTITALWGVCYIATEYNFSREDQDNFAIQSYAVQKRESGKFDNEVVRFRFHKERRPYHSF
jgi:acetyl-CoA acetyltransferase